VNLTARIQKPTVAMGLQINQLRKAKIGPPERRTTTSTIASATGVALLVIAATTL
jgi:hypothetical protein